MMRTAVYGDVTERLHRYIGPHLQRLDAYGIISKAIPIGWKYGAAKGDDAVLVDMPQVIRQTLEQLDKVFQTLPQLINCKAVESPASLS